MNRSQIALIVNADPMPLMSFVHNFSHYNELYLAGAVYYYRIRTHKRKIRPGWLLCTNNLDLLPYMYWSIQNSDFIPCGF